MEKTLAITIGKPEQRFREGLGVQFLKDGRIRCHALAKNKVYQWRVAHDNDWETPSDELWPECQCHLGAEPGFYVCRFHGGETPRTVNPPRSIADTLPDSLASKYAALMANPDYISRKEQIVLTVARQMELMEDLSEQAGNEEAWGMVAEAAVLLKQGETVQAEYLLDKALDYTNREKEIWREYYQTNSVLRDLTNTQVKTAKELKQMATTEQIQYLMQNMETIIVETGKRYVHDADKRREFIADVGAEFARFNINRNPAVVRQLIGAGSSTDADTE